MAMSMHSCRLAVIAVVTAAAVALVPTVTAAQARVPGTVSDGLPIQLAASVQPAVDAGKLPNLLAGWLERIAVPPSAGQPVPTPQFVPAVGGTSIDSTIKNVYNAVEPWVQYGFELATYAVGWIPVVGWLSPQIMIFYNFGERIARSVTFNVADWLGGNVSFVQGLANVGRDTVNSFIQLGVDELHFFLPPLPPFPFVAKAATTPVTAAGARRAVKVGKVSRDGTVGAVDTTETPTKRATTPTKPTKPTKTEGTVRSSHGRAATTAGPAAPRPRRSAGAARTA